MLHPPSIENIQTAVDSSQPVVSQPVVPSHFLVCGLGRLGYYCVTSLKEFSVLVSAIDIRAPNPVDAEALLRQLESFWEGDCRQAVYLEQTQIQRYRAVMLVTSDERVNIEAAFAVRSLNPHVRLVVRSAKESLNELLSKQLGNFVAFEATQLPTHAFAIAALGNENQGFIDLDGHLLRVVQQTVTPQHRWCDRRFLHELNTTMTRMLSHRAGGTTTAMEVFNWDPNARVRMGDTLTYVELSDRLNQPMVRTEAAAPGSEPSPYSKSMWQRVQSAVTPLRMHRWLQHLWHATEQQQTKRVALVVGVLIVLLLLVGTVVLHFAIPNTTFADSLYMSAMLLLDSYDALLSLTGDRDTIPGWLQVLHVCFALAGTASIGVLYALLTESLLAAKFQLPQKRQPLPKADHIVVVGLGRVGKRVASFLESLQEEVVGVHSDMLEAGVLPQLPIVIGNPTVAIAKVNLSTARGIVLCTEDEIDNLELAMMANSINPNLRVVIRTYDPRFSQNMDRVMPFANVLCAYELAAEAFVAAAFGENVLSLFRLNEQTIIVTEYFIEQGDTLNGLLLSEVAYGYRVVPLLHSRKDDNVRLMPSDDVRLHQGDRMVVLASSEGLQRIERGDRLQPTWWVQVERAFSKDAHFEGATTIARVAGCALQPARDVMEHIPTQVPVPMYHHQAIRMVRELHKVGVTAKLMPEAD
ncbi:NAD-binding protein [Leptolyngbya sp. AN02str]|uniref:NAD-binding protein n=1 Tax=Leptolyngbya sp. AN02str TaxID=3423363 RepID=UPI003D3119AF